MAVQTPDRDYRLNALKNNTFDSKVLEKTLSDIQVLSYKSLLDVQKNIAGFFRYDFTKSDLSHMIILDNKYVEYPKNYLVKVPEDFIAYYERDVYRNSSLYDKPLTRRLIAKNHKIFSRNILLFIDGKYVNDDKIFILCREDITYLVINEENYTDSNKYTLFFIPNEEYAQIDINVFGLSNTSSLHNRAVIGIKEMDTVNDETYQQENSMYDKKHRTHTIEITPEMAKTFTDNYKEFNQPTSRKASANMSNDDPLKTMDYRRNFLMFENGLMKPFYKEKCEYSRYGYSLDFAYINRGRDANYTKKMEYLTLPYYNIVSDGVVKHQMVEDGGTVWIRPSLHIQKHNPKQSVSADDIIVHKDNILIFKKESDADGDIGYSFMHEFEIQQYYPDIFRIKLSDTSIDMNDYIFVINYHIRNEMFDYRINDFSLLRHENLYPYKFKVLKQHGNFEYQWFTKPENKFFKYNNKLTDRDPLLEFYRNAYIENQYPDILNYQPYTVEYDHRDFWKEDGYFNDSFKYKSEKLKSLIKTNNWLLSIYNKNLDFENDSYYIDLSKVKLHNRIRSNSSQDVPDTNDDFGKEHYVFKFNRDITVDLYHLRIFIDGLLYLPEHVYVTRDHVIFYIPKDKITQNSMMEIERLYQYVKTYFHTFTDDNFVEFIVDDKYTRLNNEDVVLLVDGAYVSRDDFKLETYLDDEWLSTAKDSFLPIDTKFRVKVTNNALYNKRCTVMISRKATILNKKILSENDLSGVLKIQYDGVNDPRLFRLFKNGRLVPAYGSIINFTKKYKDTHSVFVSTKLKVNDDVVVDVLPYRYIEILYKELLDENGLLDLRDVIQRPFDLAWYDIYVNGRKLNKSQVSVITPTLIQIKNVNSRKNVTIYQRDRVTDYFRLTDPEIGYHCPEDIILKYETIKNKLIAGMSITDTEENHVEKSDNIITSAIYEELYDEVLNSEDDFSFRFINPDLEQVTPQIEEYYKETLDEYKRLTISADMRFYSTKELELNPDNK